MTLPGNKIPSVSHSWIADRASEMPCRGVRSLTVQGLWRPDAEASLMCCNMMNSQPFTDGLTLTSTLGKGQEGVFSKNKCLRGMCVYFSLTWWAGAHATSWWTWDLSTDLFLPSSHRSGICLRPAAACLAFSRDAGCLLLCVHCVCTWELLAQECCIESFLFSQLNQRHDWEGWQLPRPRCESTLSDHWCKCCFSRGAALCPSLFPTLPRPTFHSAFHAFASPFTLRTAFPFVVSLSLQSTMLQAIERYMKQAIVDKVPSVSSSALVSSLVCTPCSTGLRDSRAGEQSSVVGLDILRVSGFCCYFCLCEVRDWHWLCKRSSASWGCGCHGQVSACSPCSSISCCCQHTCGEGSLLLNISWNSQSFLHPYLMGCCGFISFQHLLKTSYDVVKRWVNEAQEAASSDNIMVQVGHPPPPGE